MEGAAAELEQVVREEWGRLVALLLAQFLRLDLVEDALGDAVEAAELCEEQGHEAAPLLAHDLLELLSLIHI